MSNPINYNEFNTNARDVFNLVREGQAIEVAVEIGGIAIVTISAQDPNISGLIVEENLDRTMTPGENVRTSVLQAAYGTPAALKRENRKTGIEETAFVSLSRFTPEKLTAA